MIRTLQPSALPRTTVLSGSFFVHRALGKLGQVAIGLFFFGQGLGE